MKINKIKKEKNKMYRIELENQTLIVHEEILLKYEILLKKKINEQEVQSILIENKYLTSYYDALKYITKKMRSQKEVQEFLQKKEYNKEEINRTINRLQKEKYIDDTAYQESFIHDKIALTLDGPLLIKRELAKLGITDTSKVDEIPTKVWQERVAKIISRRQKSLHKESIHAFKQKVKNYLVVHGYNEELFMSQLEKLELPENLDYLAKECEKLLAKAQNKDAKTLYHIKGKLYRKGFSLRDIERVLEEKL